MLAAQHILQTIFHQMVLIQHLLALQHWVVVAVEHGAADLRQPQAGLVPVDQTQMVPQDLEASKAISLLQELVMETAAEIAITMVLD